jgi:hypothetical protein
LSVLPELDVADSELLRTALVVGTKVGVFANPQKVIEGGVGEITDGLGFGRLRVEALLDAPARDADWDCELGLRDWILATVAFDLLLEGLPVLGGVAIAVAGVQSCIQFEVRADGT